MAQLNTPGSQQFLSSAAAGSSNANSADGNAILPSDPALSQPNLYQPRGPITMDLYKTLSYVSGIWLWSNQYGFEVLSGDRLYRVDEQRGRITDRLARGEWVDWNIAEQRAWVEEGTQVMYQAVPGPVTYVDVNGQVYTPSHIRIDENGRRYRCNFDGTWTLTPGFTQLQQNDDGTFDMTNRAEGVPGGPSAWPIKLPPIPFNDPAILWQGLKSIYREPPRPQAVEGATANDPLVASVALDRPGSPIPDPRLADPAWQQVDRWLTAAFPVEEYPAADSLDLRLRHMDAYFARQPAPILPHPMTDYEKRDLWISVQVEVLIPCIWDDSPEMLTAFAGKNPIQLRRPHNVVRGSKPDDYDSIAGAQSRMRKAISDLTEVARADGGRRRIAHWDWRAQDINTYPSVALTDDHSKWCWRIESGGVWPTPNSMRTVNMQKWTISPAFHMLEERFTWPAEVSEMFDHLHKAVPWYVAPKSQPTTVEIGPTKGYFFSTTQLRDIASFWYACEPYLTSLLSPHHVDEGLTRPVHGRCRAAWNEPAERANWLCRLTENGSKFPAFPMPQSKKMPERTQSADDLANNGLGDDEAGTYNLDKERQVARGSTVLHNGVDPAKDFFARQPQDYNGNPTGMRDNLFRLNRHRVINNIQRACSSPAVALMMTSSGQPFAAGRAGEYLDLSNYGAANLGAAPKTARNSIKIRMAPSSVYGSDIAAWMFIAAVVVQPAASDGWESLCEQMPPPHELVRPTAAAAQGQTNDAAPSEYRTRYSQKYDVFDLLYKLGLHKEVLDYVQTQMIHGWDGDGHLWGHLCARAM